jgi:tryptophanyl-tRNA synthetase
LFQLSKKKRDTSIRQMAKVKHRDPECNMFKLLALFLQAEESELARISNSYSRGKMAAEVVWAVWSLSRAGASAV